MKKIFNISSKYNTMAAVIAGGLVLAVLIGALLIRPAWGSLQTLGEEIPQEQQARDLKEQDFQNLEKAKVFLEENGQTVEEVNTTVPIEPEVPSILVILESLAKQNGVFLTSFSPQQLGPGQPPAGASAGEAEVIEGGAAVDSIEIAANFRGPYTSLINFLYSLERSLRIVDVKTITVNSSTGDLEGSITFRAYYKTVQGVPAPGESEVETEEGQ